VLNALTWWLRDSSWHCFFKRGPQLGTLDVHGGLKNQCTKKLVLYDTPCMSQTYSTADAVRLTHIKADMLNYLCKMGIVVPTVTRREGVRGHGKQRRYNFSDLVLFKVVKRLAASGVQPLKVKRAIRELHTFGVSLHRLPSTHVVMFDQSAYLWDGVGDPFRIADGQRAFGFILDVGSIRAELIADIEALAA
jgi:DNA-binding transcriptional MerR regulator